MSKAIETFAKATGILAATALVLSVIYDWGFLYSLGLNYSTVPTTIADHVRSALVWVPNTLFAMFIGLSIEFINQRIERGLTEEEIIQSSKNPARLRKFRKGPSVLFRVFAPIAVGGFLLLGDLYRGIIPLALMVVWSMFSEWANGTPLIKLRRNGTAMALFHWLPIVFFIVFFMGYNNAADIASKSTPSLRVTLEGTTAQFEVSGLRYLERGTLALDPTTKRITFLPWNQVRKLEFTETYKPYGGLLGGWLSQKAPSNKVAAPDRQETVPTSR